jgi:hypothetical protein
MENGERCHNKRFFLTQASFDRISSEGTLQEFYLPRFFHQEYCSRRCQIQE